ncbi:unnamed protein product [Closterium sp. NIES-54]
MENIFDNYDLLEVMEGTEKRLENDPEQSPWVRKSAQGYLLLGQALGSSQIRHIKPFQRELEKGQEAWAALKGVHALQGCHGGGSPLEDMKRAILQEDFRRRELASADGAGAASIGRGYGRGRGRGQGGGRFGSNNFNGGHGSGGYGSDNKSYERDRCQFDGECHYCHKSGHMWRDCLKLPNGWTPAQGQEGREARGGRGRGRGGHGGRGGGAASMKSASNESKSRDDRFPEVKGMGKTMFKGADEKMVGLKNVLWVPNLATNLISVRRLQKAGMDTSSKGAKTYTARLGKRILWEFHEDRDIYNEMWQIPVVPMPEERQVAASISTKGEVVGSSDGANGRAEEIESKKCNLGGTSKLGEDDESGAAAQKQHKDEENPKAAAEEECGENMWGTIASAAFSNPTSATGECDWLTLHRRMGHVALPILKQLVKNEMVAYIRVKGEPDEVLGCPTCMQAKFTRYPFSSSEAMAKAPLDEVVMDVVGPQKLGAAGAEYFLTILDVYIRMTWVYVLSKKSDVAETRSFMVVYVLDILIFSPSSDLVKEVMLKLQDKFKCKALGDVSFYLGLHIKQDVEKRCMRVHQQKYFEALAANFGQSEGHVATPFPSGFKCVKGPEEESVGEEERRRFHSLVSSLMYAAVNNRPDFAFATGQLARVVQCPNEEHVAAGMRVAKYLGQTATVGLQYSAAAQRRQKCADGVEPGRLFLTAFSDASYASDAEDMTSVGGFICCVGGGPTVWESKKQVDQALSSVESEYMALFRAIREIVWQRRLLAKLGKEQQGPTLLYCDSQGAIALAKKPVLHGLTKHMRVKWHWTRSMVAMGEVELHYVKTMGQPADMMTKMLVELQHWKCCKLAGMVLN